MSHYLVVVVIVFCFVCWSDGAAASVSWGLCPKSWRLISGIECRSYHVPLDWSDPKGKNIDFVVGRSTAVSRGHNQTRGHMWFLGGYPNGAEVSINAALAIADVSMDFYFPKFRGEDYGMLLKCSDFVKRTKNDSTIDWEQCMGRLQATWGPEFHLFSLTNAARDIRSMMDKVYKAFAKLDSKRVPRAVLYGTGFGSLMAVRIAQFDNEREYSKRIVSSVILDGVMSPDLLLHSPLNPSVAVPGTLDMCLSCASNERCSGYPPTLSMPEMTAAYKQMLSPSCKQVDDLEILSVAANAFPAFENVCQGIVKVATMIARCNKADVEALKALVKRTKKDVEDVKIAHSYISHSSSVLTYIGLWEARHGQLISLSNIRNLSVLFPMPSLPAAPASNFLFLNGVGISSTPKAKQILKKRKFQSSLSSMSLLVSLPILGGGCVRAMLTNYTLFTSNLSASLCLPEAFIDWNSKYFYQQDAMASLGAEDNGSSNHISEKKKKKRKKKNFSYTADDLNLLIWVCAFECFATTLSFVFALRFKPPVCALLRNISTRF